MFLKEDKAMIPVIKHLVAKMITVSILDYLGQYSSQSQYSLIKVL